ncbi:MAG: response regulator, partial [Synergistales bacterium]|nr:response regulator [Synergistales bacterium]
VMDGMEAARRIRTSGKAYRGIPIVALTAHALPGDRERFLQAGMDGYIAKPVERGNLVATCRELFRTEPAAAWS